MSVTKTGQTVITPTEKLVNVQVTIGTDEIIVKDKRGKLWLTLAGPAEMTTPEGSLTPEWTLPDGTRIGAFERCSKCNPSTRSPLTLEE